MAAISKNERLLNLVAFLLKARRPVALAEIRRSVIGYKDALVDACSLQRRFERDKAALRELGVPLVFLSEQDPGGPGYVIKRDAYFLPRMELSSAEAALLALASRLALEGAAGPISDALQSALRKLQFDSPIPGGIRENVEEHFLLHRGGLGPTESEQANLRELTSAILDRRVVRFSYQALGQERKSRRIVEPYGIGFSSGHWYLVGYDRRRKAIRSFRTDRIRGLVKRLRPDATAPEFEVPADFRVQDHVGVPAWLFGKAQRISVRIRLDADVAFMVRLRPAPGDEWQDLPDGSGILTRQATHLDALLNWVLSLGRHAEVLDPPEFRQRVLDALREMAARHEAQPDERARDE